MHSEACRFTVTYVQTVTISIGCEKHLVIISLDQSGEIWLDINFSSATLQQSLAKVLKPTFRTFKCVKLTMRAIWMSNSSQFATGYRQIAINKDVTEEVRSPACRSNSKKTECAISQDTSAITTIRETYYPNAVRRP